MANFCKNCGQKINGGNYCSICSTTGQKNLISNNQIHEQNLNNNLSMQIAKSDKRLLNFIIDIIGVLIFAYPFGFFLGLIFS